MKEMLKKLLSLALCLCMVFCLAACEETGSSRDDDDDDDDRSDYSEEYDQENEEEEEQTENTDSAATPDVQQITGENGDLRYVMIYNPDIYVEDSTSNTSLNTGDFGKQVDVSAVRAEALEETTDNPFKPWNAANDTTEKPKPEELTLDGDRADVMLTPYAKGDTKDFYYYNESLTARQSGTFTCMYAGTYCNIWTVDPNVTAEVALYYGQIFDNSIYVPMTEQFGTARFAENGGKVNLLFYPMGSGVAGCFSLADKYSSSECSLITSALYKMNTDHAILSINSTYAIYQNYANLFSGTMAHEFQHMICETDASYALTEAACTTWLNEAMSGYAEESLFPGSISDSGNYESFANSDSIRYGQSLYNFDNDGDDIGVYGSVYLFSEYLVDLTSQETTYRQFHDGWRNSYSQTICDSEGLYSIMPQSAISKIDSVIDYPDSLQFATEQDEWMSKLALDFHLSVLTQSAGSPDAYSNVDPSTLLYDEINPADIEGGGRVIVAVKDGVYDIPADADSGLVYIGLDANFQPVTDFIVK